MKDKKKYVLDIDLDNTGIKISDRLFGLFYEDISSAADGGLAAEQIKNNSFENYINIATVHELPHGNEKEWKMHWFKSGSGEFNVVRDENTSINKNNMNYACILGDVTLKNYGHAPNGEPETPSIAIKSGRKFDCSIWAKADESYNGTISVVVVDENDTPITNKVTIDFVRDGRWHKSEVSVLTGTADKRGVAVFEFFGADKDEKICVDMLSVSPQDTYGYKNPNYACGKGLRYDLVKALIDLKPGFIRFPGGCIIEGNMGHHSYYNWENSIGPLEERKANSNHWVEKYDENTGYMQSYELGYHEYLTLCEDMGAEAFPILSAGVFCQFARPDGGEKDSFPQAVGEELTKFAIHAVHLIDYCLGDEKSQNKTQAYWAKKRAENGHPEPFNLNYIGIGNENWGENKYWPNFDYIKDYIDAFMAENYPNRKITVISSAGSSAEGEAYQYAYKHLGEKYKGETLVDEHYYAKRDFMLHKDMRYDFYKRISDGGSEVFVGEYALKENNLNELGDAIIEAAYMTGFERNGDIVRHASYAPLFARYGLSTWTPNLIWFDDRSVMKTPNYYVQKMFSNNYGHTLINTVIKTEGKMYDKNYGSPILATYNAKGKAHKIRVVRSDGKVLLEDNFTKNGENTAHMKWESMNGDFEICGGSLSIGEREGYNILWMPDAALSPEWYDYTVEVETETTVDGAGVIVGAGGRDKDTFYMYKVGRTHADMLIKREDLELQRIGNNFDEFYPELNENKSMTIRLVYGVGGELVGEFWTENAEKMRDFASKIRPYQNELYQVCSKDDRYVYLKLVNTDDFEKWASISFKNLDENECKITCLSGEYDVINRIDKEDAVPHEYTKCLAGGKLEYTVPKNSFTVLRVKIV